jgi:hypothetical protein
MMSYGQAGRQAIRLGLCRMRPEADHLRSGVQVITCSRAICKLFILAILMRALQKASSARITTDSAARRMPPVTAVPAHFRYRCP